MKIFLSAVNIDALIDKFIPLMPACLVSHGLSGHPLLLSVRDRRPDMHTSSLGEQRVIIQHCSGETALIWGAERDLANFYILF